MVLLFDSIASIQEDKEGARGAEPSELFQWLRQRVPAGVSDADLVHASGCLEQQGFTPEVLLSDDGLSREVLQQIGVEKRGVQTAIMMAVQQARQQQQREDMEVSLFQWLRQRLPARLQDADVMQACERLEESGFCDSRTLLEYEELSKAELQEFGVAKLGVRVAIITALKQARLES